MSDPSPNHTESHGLSRRDALRGGAAASAGLWVATGPLNHAQIAQAKKRPVASDGSFDWGVSCGYPAPRSAIIWTRVGELDRTSRIRWEVSTDRSFKRTVAKGFALARRRKDFTVHAKVKGLKPRTEYFYRFFTKNSKSMVGRFRTLPPGDSLDPVKIGFFSCQAWNPGFYNAHDGLADEDLDLVLCLGDYIYEDGTYDIGVRSDETGDNGDGDAQKLREYRQKYRLYQSDPSLQRMHANHGFVAIWDDHEVEDNYAGSEPSPAADEGFTNPGDERRVSMKQRQRNGYHAFFEAMPRRRRSGDPTRIFERAKLGRMADLLLLDQRQYRDQQPCGDAFFTPCAESNDPGRNYLGRKQMGWLKNRLSSSKAEWKVIGNQLMLMSFDIAPGIPLLQDSWEGYGAERMELGNHIAGNVISDVLALTGDIHTFFAGNTTTTGRINGEVTGVEFVGGSITSLGVKETLGNIDGIENLENVIGLADPHISYADFDRRGYGVLSLTSEEATCEFRSPTVLNERGGSIETIAKFRVAKGSTDIDRLV